MKKSDKNNIHQKQVMLRNSHYNVFSRRHSDTGEIIVLNGIIGSMDLISPKLATELEYYSHSSTRLPHEIQRYFLQRGYLTNTSDEEEKENLCTVAEVIHKKLSEIPHFLILPQLDCNFRCTYCYEKPLQKYMKKGRNCIDSACTIKDAEVNYSTDMKKVMNEATVTHTFQAISDIIEMSGSNINSHDLVLYGGEPLDASIERTVRCIVKEGEQRGFSLGAVTNGYDIPVFLDLFSKTQINNVQITIDGPRDIHDKRRIVRPYAETKAIARGQPGGSYDTIVNNVGLLIGNRDIDVTLRVNTDASTLPTFDRLITAIEDYGWFRSPRFLMYASIIYKKDEKGHIWSDYSNKELYNYLKTYSLKYPNFIILGKTGNYGLKFKDAIANSTTAPLQPVFCGANKGMYLFAPDSRIYPCWESVLSPEFAIGTFETNSKYDLQFNAEKDHWFKRNATLISECIGCRYVLFCGGGCAIYAYYNSGDSATKKKGSIYGPFCDTFQEWFPDVIMDMYEELEREKSEVNELK